MMVRISARVFDAAGRDAGELDATLNWVLGYFSKKCPNVGLLTHLAESGGSTVTVEISDEVASKILNKFGECKDSLVSTLLSVAYSLGGME
ncbi:hypothetical protein [Magnetospirillum aberrantis]|uniref:Uncharacterized protein n=1 Tax=Magnetospirillum aberrantis SpK TaxID=908842 RepID=A0A7C9UU16_9PROT|nr:hypothetical protein [Magnetospirillum aberrantis]NFV79009.1 hypothetical protein [Magnetospirillum aberrantis SpK]